MSACKDCLRHASLRFAEIDATVSKSERIEQRNRSGRTDVDSVCRHDGEFPTAILDLPDAPYVLHLLGDRNHLACLGADPVIAIVGSRRASSYGLEVAQSLAHELVACGVVVVSGMAFGIDSAAHEGALAGGGLTVAVLGGGADVPYPRSKRGLHRRIVSKGLVLSELPPGTSPRRWCFPARNRIMAALATMTIVVEGTDKSGSLITARFASELGREVGAVPGQITSSVAAGSNALLADGACVVRSVRDVLDAVLGPGSIAAPGAALSQDPELNVFQQSLLEEVEQGKGSADAIAVDPDDVQSVLVGLTELELLGLIRREPDGSYVRCA